MNLNLPKHLVQAHTQMGHADGANWVNQLPTLVAECAQRWSLSLAQPFPYDSANYVAPATRADGTAVVLKMRLPNQEFLHEVEALKCYNGQGIVLLLDADLEHGALLLEQLCPGTLLSSVADHEQATAIAAHIMRALWRPVWRPAPEAHAFPRVADWVQHMAERAPALIGPLHTASTSRRRLAHWIDYALGKFRELSSEPATPVLLHGDLHHFNILAAEREPWLAIDPFGVLGEPACEVAPWLFNRVPDPFERDVAQRVLVPCVDQLAAELNIDRARLAAWGVVRSVIAAFWTLEDNGEEWDDVLGCAELLAEMAQ